MGKLQGRRGPEHAEMISAWDNAVESACAEALRAERFGDEARAEVAFARLQALVETASMMAQAAS